MTLAREVIDTGQALVSQRTGLEKTWEFISALMFPHPDRQFRQGSTSLPAMQDWTMGFKLSERAAQIYDITAIIALERLTTGMISLICPDNEKWQALKVDTPFGYEASDGETKWLERQRDYLFAVRYDPRSGWALANQAAIRSACALGVGAYVVEENFGGYGTTAAQVPYYACNLPISNNYLTTNAQGMHDQDFRFLDITARQACQLFNKSGDRISPKLMAQANDPQTANMPANILHYIGERQEAGPLQGAIKGQYRCASIYVEVDGENLIRHSGFNYWPVIVYTWNQIPGSAYGESPAMLVLSEVFGTNVLAKNTLLGTQSYTRPPVATADDADSRTRPNLNPAGINYGALTENGELRIKPIFTVPNPSWSQVVLDASRSVIKDGLYTNLWQILIQNPQMTATEALIRANEKGELLGPVGTRIQGGLSRHTDAELAIVESKGGWRPGSPLEPPQSLRKRGLSTHYTSPLERLRRSGELVGIQQTLGVVQAIAAFDASVTDNIDGDAVFKVAREVTGAPASIARSDEEKQKMRQSREQQQKLALSQQVADVAKTGAEAAGAGVPAIQQLGQILNRGAPATPSQP